MPIRFTFRGYLILTHIRITVQVVQDRKAVSIVENTDSFSIDCSCGSLWVPVYYLCFTHFSTNGSELKPKSLLHSRSMQCCAD